MDLAIIHYVRFQWSKNQLCKKKTTLTTILQSTCYNTQAHFNSQNLLTEFSSSRPRWQLKTDNVYKVDQAVENGGSPKSKGTDLITRVAIALSKVNYIISAMLNGQTTNHPPETITEEMYNKATLYVQHLHTQKPRIYQTHCQTCNRKKIQQCVSVHKQEYDVCTQAIHNFRQVVEICFPYCAKRLHVFIKKTPTENLDYQIDTPCTKQEYQQQIFQPLSRLVQIVTDCARRTPQSRTHQT